jgi:hypothetical protein
MPRGGIFRICHEAAFCMSFDLRRGSSVGFLLSDCFSGGYIDTYQVGIFPFSS